MHGQPLWIARLNIFKRWAAAFVALNRDDVCRIFKQQRPCQSAGTWADFDDRALGHIAAKTRDAARDVEVEQEILT